MVRRSGIAALVAVAAAVLSGCGESRPTGPAARSQWAGGEVAVRFADPAARAEFLPRMTAWAKRNGVTVKEADGPAADVLVTPAYALGGPAAAGELLPVPESVIGENAGFQWGGLLRVYQSALVRWGNREVAIPLSGDGYVLLYRSDRLTDPAVRDGFTRKHSRPPLPIRTWEDLAEVGAFVSETTGKPALAPLPADGAAAFHQFCQLAACYDRRPWNGGQQPKDDQVDYYRRGLSFLVDVETGDPRVSTPAVVEAFRWFADTRNQRPAAGDPLDALLNGSAVAAVVSLADVQKLPIDPKTGAVDKRVGVSELPGTRSYFDPKGGRVKVDATNFVPYYGGGLVGAVRKSAATPDACWAMLADLGGLAGSATTLEAPGLGAGPLRGGHVSDDARTWRHLKFDADRTAEVSRAMQRYAAVGVLNPAIGLRTPDRAELVELIVKQLRRAAAGEVTAEQAAKQASDDWNTHDAKTPAADRRTIRRKAAGVE
jgi:ABC-type glycerol-3-phosphate transport system substrate-binding protein